MTTHFRGNRRYLYEFSDLFLVHCPRCEKCARVLPVEPIEAEPTTQRVTPYTKLLFAPRHLSCTHCGYSGDWAGKKVSQSDDGRDWYFDCLLWLKVPCCGEVLWAFNDRHLQFLEDFVSASFRETHYNASMASRLPEWMKLGKNRVEVLKCIEKLRGLLAHT
jgi:hypothetical protein